MCSAKRENCPNSARPTVIGKPKRVRTGCLTCRERHLKCDEKTPDCLNCRKSNRPCKRGVRLNFLDITVHDPARLSHSGSWTVEFRDESRQIASEYRGGLRRYAGVSKLPDKTYIEEIEAILQQRHSSLGISTQLFASTDAMKLGLIDFDVTECNKTATSAASGVANSYSNDSQNIFDNYKPDLGQTIPEFRFNDGRFRYTTAPFPVQASPAWTFETSKSVKSPRRKRSRLKTASNTIKNRSSTTVTMELPVTTWSNRDQLSLKMTAANGDACLASPGSRPVTTEREFLRSAEEIHYMQAFVEEVAIWMDPFDQRKHFSQIIPYLSLKCPMLLNSLLACGVRHISLLDPQKDDTARFYYNTAKVQLVRSLQNPERSRAECAMAAIILNVYGLMSYKSSRQTNHYSDAGILIRGCSWDASSSGVGSACFWLHIGMEVFNCMSMDWVTSWDPDAWGLDMSWTGDDVKRTDGGDEELWVQRIFYILAKVANFRALASLFVEASLSGEQMRLGCRLPEWRSLKRLCDIWNNVCPRTMHPMGYLYAKQTNPASLFPKVWLPKGAAVLGRLFYHTAQCILAQTNPVEPDMISEEMRALQLHHAHEVCGIVAHSEDRGIRSVSIQALVIVSTVLVELDEQMEVIHVLEKIEAQSGWRLESEKWKLSVAWGWSPVMRPPEQVNQDSVRSNAIVVPPVDAAGVDMCTLESHFPALMDPLGSQLDSSFERPPFGLNIAEWNITGHAL